MNQEDYIKSKMSDFTLNINDFTIGEVICDLDDNQYIITDKTLNSIEIYINKRSDQGIDCKQWFTMTKFVTRFKKIM